MNFTAHRLPPLPADLHVPRAWERHLAGLLGGGPACPWPPELDREQLLRGLAWHRIGPVLYRQGGPAALPDWLREPLRQAYFHCAARNLAHVALLRRLTEACRAAGFEVLLLKGAGLLYRVYADLGVRPMDDLDLLVRPGDLDGVCEVFRACGCVELPRTLHDAYDHHRRFRAPGPGGAGVLVELHWRLTAHADLEPCLPVGEAWCRALPAPPPLGTALVFDLPDSLLHAVLHLAEHGGLARLVWLADLHRLGGRLDSVGWQELAGRAVRHHLHLALAAGLQEAAHWFGTAPPADFWEQLAHGLPPGPAAEAAFAHYGRLDPLTRQLHEFRARRTLGGKLRHLWGLLLPDPALLRRRYRPRNRLLLPLYYGVRLADGLWRAGRALLAGRPHPPVD